MTPTGDFWSMCSAVEFEDSEPAVLQALLFAALLKDPCLTIAAAALAALSHCLATEFSQLKTLLGSVHQSLSRRIGAAIRCPGMLPSRQPEKPVRAITLALLLDSATQQGVPVGLSSKQLLDYTLCTADRILLTSRAALSAPAAKIALRLLAGLASSLAAQNERVANPLCDCLGLLGAAVEAATPAAIRNFADEVAFACQQALADSPQGAPGPPPPCTAFLAAAAQMLSMAAADSHLDASCVRRASTRTRGCCGAA